MRALRAAPNLIKWRSSSVLSGYRLFNKLNYPQNISNRTKYASPKNFDCSLNQIIGSGYTPKRYAWFTSKSNEIPDESEVPDESILPPGAEGVPFRLATEDALEAYARWSWQESPWFTPIQPERLRPIYAPFWIFEFVLTVTDTETGSVTKVPYRNLYGNSNMQYYRRKAAQIYAGQRFNRLLVDVLKAPVSLARRWNGQEMLALPKERAYGVFTQYEEEFEDDEELHDEDRKSKPTFTKTVRRERKNGDVQEDEKYMSLFPNPDFTIKNPPPPRPIELDAFTLSETIAWGRVQEAVVSTELAILHHHYVNGTNISSEYGKVAQEPTKAGKNGFGIFNFFSKNAKQEKKNEESNEMESTENNKSSQAPLGKASSAKNDVDLDFDDLRAAFMFRAHGTLGSASANPEEAGLTSKSIKQIPFFSKTSSKSVQNIKDRYKFSFEDIQSRRVYLPGYVTEYKSLMKYWRVFTSGVTGETFGLQQLGPLGLVNLAKQLKFHPWMMVLVNDLNLKIGAILLRKLLMTPAAAIISTVAGTAVMLSRRLSAHRQESEIEEKWNQIREDEAKMDAFLSSGRDLWMFRRPANEIEKRQSLEAKRLWEFITREDIAHRERIKRQEERKKKQELEKQRLENLAKAPPKIPEDPYELLGLERPKNQAIANAFSQHDISQSFRRQLMMYHPDTYNEETAHWSKAYSHRRTQALIEAYGQVKTPALRKAYNARYPV